MLWLILGVLDFIAVSESTCLRQKTIHFEDDCDPPRAKILVAAALPKELKQIQLDNLSPTLKSFKISLWLILGD